MPGPMPAQGCGREICRDKDCVYLIYLCFKGSHRELKAREGVQKTFVSNNIIVVTGIIITAHPPQPWPRERQGEGIQEAETCALLFLPS